MMDCMAMVLEEDTLNNLVKDETITQEKTKQTMAGEVDKTANNMKAALSSVKDDDVLKLTKETDKNSWTNEDPTLEAMKKWLKDQPK